MSYVCDVIVCPRCGKEEYHTEFNCATTESSGICMNCGYATTNELPMKSVGVLMMQAKNGVGQIVSLSRMPTKTGIEKFRKMLKDQKIDKHKSYLHIWDAKKNEVKEIK